MTIVEFAFLAPLHAVFLFGPFEVAIVQFARAPRETAAENAARQALTNKGGGLAQAKFQVQVCSNLPSFMSCGALMVNVQP